MDLKTGRIYDSREAALAAGASESDLIELDPQLQNLIRDLKFCRESNPKYERHQGKKEMARRLK